MLNYKNIIKNITNIKWTLPLIHEKWHNVAIINSLLETKKWLKYHKYYIHIRLSCGHKVTC